MSDYSAGFERFWASYPKYKRKGKGAAFKVWQRDHLEDKAADIVDVVQRQSDFDDHFQKYTPLPTTYLNQRRYDDDVPKPKAAMPSAPEPERPQEQDPYVRSVKKVAAGWLIRRGLRGRALSEERCEKALQLIHSLAADARQLHERGELTHEFAQTIRDDLDELAAR